MAFKTHKPSLADRVQEKKDIEKTLSWMKKREKDYKKDIANYEKALKQTEAEIKRLKK